MLNLTVHALTTRCQRVKGPVTVYVYIFRRRTCVGGRDVAVVRHDGILVCIAGSVSLLILASRHVKDGELFYVFQRVVTDCGVDSGK